MAHSQTAIFGQEAQLEIISACKTLSYAYKIDVDMWSIWHYHPEFDILLTLKNTGHYYCGDFMGVLKPGTLIITGPNVPHAFHPTEQSENDPDNPAMIVLQFSEDSIGRELFDKPEMSNIKQFLQDCSRSFEFFGSTRDQAEEILWKMNGMTDSQKLAHVILLLDLLANSPSQDRDHLVSPGFSPTLNESSMGRINRVTQFIMNNLTRKITLEEAADLVNMSPKSFSRFFKKNTGKNFVQYVNEMRIGQSCRQLLETKDSITEVCYASGFNNLSNFNRRFLEIKDMTPREYRRRFSKLAE